MNIVNIGSDKTLVGGKKLGDAIERHRMYGKYINHLDIIVYTKKREGLSKFKISENVYGHPTNSSNKLMFLFDAKRILKKLQREYKTDIVVCQDPFVPALIGHFAKKRFGAKLQINFHGDFWDNPLWIKERPLRNKIFLWISKYTVRRADAIRVMSEGQKEKLLKKGISEKLIRVISTPVDIERFSKAKYDASQKRYKKLVLMVGRKDRVKDFNTLFSAMEKVFKKSKDVGLMLAGNFTSHNDITLPKERVVLTGNVYTEQLPELYAMADIVVLSSTSESFGKVLVEANACGKPVVSTLTTGAKEIIQDGMNGFLVPIQDSTRLAEKILYLIENPDVADRMGEAGQKMVKEKFGNNTRKIIQFWHETLNGNKKS